MMRHLSWWALALCAACGDGTVGRVTDVRELDAACSASSGRALASGTLDVSGGAVYFAALSLKSDSSGDFAFENVVLAYTTTNPIITFETERIPIAGTLRAGESIDLAANLIAPKAAVRLTDNIVDPAQEPPTTLKVKVSIEGQAVHGGKGSLAPITFPIAVTTSGAQCQAGVAPTGPCGGPGGQDGRPVVCQ